MFQNVAVLIRTYNNNQGTVKAVSRAIKNGAGLIIVVVNAHDESTRGNVRSWLSKMMEKAPGQIVIIEMTQGYSWSNALNVGFAHVRMHNRLADIKGLPTIDFVLPTSVEVLWEVCHLEAMLHTATQSKQIGVVGTSFLGQQNGNSIDLGVSYIHPRNTFMLISMDAFQAVGLFDSVCDGLGGMEDFHFLLNLVLIGNFRWQMLDLRIKLLIGLNHNQPVKEEREQEAMRKIALWFRQLVADSPALCQRVEDTFRAFNLNF